MRRADAAGPGKGGGGEGVRVALSEMPGPLYSGWGPHATEGRAAGGGPHTGRHENGARAVGRCGVRRPSAAPARQTSRPARQRRRPAAADDLGGLGPQTGSGPPRSRRREPPRPSPPGLPSSDPRGPARGRRGRPRRRAEDREDARKTPGVVTESAASTLSDPALAGVTGRAGSCLPPERGEPRPGGCGGLRSQQQGLPPTDPWGAAVCGPKTPGVVTESAGSTFREPAFAGVTGRAGPCLPPERGEPRPNGRGGLRSQQQGLPPTDPRGPGGRPLEDPGGRDGVGRQQRCKSRLRPALQVGRGLLPRPMTAPGARDDNTGKPLGTTRRTGRRRPPQQEERRCLSTPPTLPRTPTPLPASS
jgi:hypothetical protein